jgi:type I restriction enzyme R subunit
MLGRGTRLLEENKIKPWCPEKNMFLIIDCWDNFEYFKLTPEGKEVIQQIPLPVRFVGIRLNKIEKAIDSGKYEIAEKEIHKLREQIDTLPKNSVVIIDAAPDLYRLEDENFWTMLTHDKIVFLRNNIKPLFRTISQTDFKTMRFQKDVLETSLAALSEENDKHEILKENIIEQISELPLSVNIVAKEEELIRKAQTNSYWANVTDSDMDELAEQLAPLMKFRNPAIPQTGPAQFDFKDLVKTKEFVEFGPEHESISIAKYREMVEKMIADLTDRNPILQKIKDGKEISQTEAEELAEILHDEHPNVTEDLLRRAYKNKRAKFIEFIRHILGIELLESFPETVSKAFDQFIQEHSNFNARQLDFLNLLREYIIEREKIQKRDLIQSPFTIIHPQGIRGLFSPFEIDEIVKLTERLAA